MRSALPIGILTLYAVSGLACSSSPNLVEDATTLPHHDGGVFDKDAATSSPPDGGLANDGASALDAGGDAATPDAGDAGNAGDATATVDSGGLDATLMDGGLDATLMDGGPDATPMIDGGHDGGTSEDASTAMDAGLDAGLPDSGDAGLSPAPGVQLASGSGLVVWGATRDDIVLFSDAQGVIWSVPASGGTPSQVATGLQASGAVILVGTGAFIFPTISTVGSGAFSVWTPSTGLHSGPSASLASRSALAMSRDGSKIMFLTNLNAAATQGEVVIANADMSARQTLLTAVNESPAQCIARLAFPGASNSLAIVDHCSPGSGVSTVTKFTANGTTWTPLDLVAATGPNGFVLDATGAQLMTVTSTGQIVSVTLANGQTTILDANGLVQGFYTGNGAVAVFTDATSGIVKSPTIDPTLSPLAATGLRALGPSPDESWFVYVTGYDSVSGLFDMNLGSMTGAAPTVLTSSMTSLVLGDLFTVDSSFVVWFTNVQLSTLTGTLMALPVAGGSPITLSQSAAVELAVRGSTLVYSDHFTQPANAAARADLYAVTLPSSPTPIVAQADAAIGATTDRSKVIYTYNAGAFQKGLYVYTVP